MNIGIRYKRIHMLPEIEQERATLNVEKVLDNLVAVVHIQPPLINYNPAGDPSAPKILKESTRRDASLRTTDQKKEVWDMRSGLAQ